MRQWEEKLDTFLAFNEEEFNQKRREEERLRADAEDMALLEAIQAKANS